MKLVLLMYLEGDEGCVQRLLEETGVEVFSRLPMEGIAPGSSGWYGKASPYRSQAILAVVEASTAKALLKAVESCEGMEDPDHPIRAVQMPVEAVSSCNMPGEAQSSTDS